MYFFCISGWVQVWIISIANVACGQSNRAFMTELCLFPGSFTPRWFTPWPSTNPSLGSTSSMGWCVCYRFCRSSGLRSSCGWLSNSCQAMYKAPLLNFLSPSNLYHDNSPCANNVFFFFFFPGQDIVQDERSDKEETESEDEGEELREKSKNGHMQNGHIPFNNNHRKRKWLDFSRLCDDRH